MKRDIGGLKNRIKTGTWGLIYIIILIGFIIALVPVYNTFFVTSDTGAGGVHYACAPLNNTPSYLQSIYHNNSTHINKWMEERGWSEEQARQSAERVYSTVRYDELEGLRRERVNAAIRRSRQYPTADIRNGSLNVSIRPSIGSDIHRTFVERNESVYFCAMGYTGGA